MTATRSGIVERCLDLIADLDFTSVREWKAAVPGRLAIGYLPAWVPLEIVHAAGMLPVGILGGGALEGVRGDAYFQSYICHLPRSTLELGLSGRLDVLDGMLFPSTCDVIRNLSGMWSIMFPNSYVRYFELPQNFGEALGGCFLRLRMEALRDDLARLGGRSVRDQDLARSIALYDENRRVLRKLQAFRAERPWQAPAVEVHAVVRAGAVLPVEEHTALVTTYLAAAEAEERPWRDDCRVALRGLFCELPPLEVLRAIERAGCAVVDDDAFQAGRAFTADVGAAGDPLEALVLAWLRHGAPSPSRFHPEAGARGEALLEAVREARAEGVIFASPSFCDPALLDRPLLAAALARAGVPHMAFKYAENAAPLHPIREQAGAFADSVKLWGEA